MDFENIEGCTQIVYKNGYANAQDTRMALFFFRSFHFKIVIDPHNYAFEQKHIWLNMWLHAWVN
jgi:hypothetical protein